MFAAASGIQVATLVVAGLAVVASITGIFFNARLSARSEHSVWQRDLRIQLYGALASSAERFTVLLSKHPASTLKERMIAHEDVFQKLTEVSTYGSIEVRKAGEDMFGEFTNNLFEDSFESRSEAGNSLTKYRSAVRKSLKIGDE